MERTGEILNSLIKNEKISESELARQTGIAQPIIHRIVHGQNVNPKIATLRPIANYFHITVSQLIGETAITNTPNLETDCSPQPIPLITWQDITLWSKNKKELSNQCTKIITGLQNNNKALYATQINNSAMEPKFSKHTIIIVDPARTPANGDHVLVSLPSQMEVIFRQLLIEGKTHYLKSLNPAKTTIFNSHDQYKGVIIQSIENFTASY